MTPDEDILTPLKPEWQDFTDALFVHLHLSNPDEDAPFTSCCDGTFRLCKNLIRNRYPWFDVPGTLDYFRANGWYCDCDVFTESPSYLGEKEAMAVPIPLD